MKNLALLLFYFLISITGFSQTCEQIIKSAKKLAFQDKNYELAIKKLGAIFIAKCEKQKVREANNLVNQIYIEVNNQRLLAEKATMIADSARKYAEERKVEAETSRDLARLAQDVAQTQRKIAEKQRDRSTALYWASEADKLNPIQGLRLLEEAAKKTTDTNAIDFVKEQTVKIFNNCNIHQFKEKQRFNEAPNIFSATFSPNNKWLALVTSSTKDNITNYNIHFRNIESGEVFDSLSIENGAREPVFSSDSKMLITITDGYKYEVREMQNFGIPDFLKEERSFWDAEISSDNKWLITLNDFGNKYLEYRVWNLGNQKEADFLKEEKGINHLALSPDSKWLLTSKRERGAILWRLEGEVKNFFLKDEGHVLVSSFSKDGNWLFTRNINGKCKVWETLTGKSYNFLMYQEGVFSANFSNDNKWLITESRGLGYKVWNLETHKEQLFRSGEYMKKAIFSPDSKWLFTINSSNECQLWDMVNNNESHLITDENNEIQNAFFSENSKWLITESIHSNIYPYKSSRVWDLEKVSTLNILMEAIFLDEEDMKYNAVFSPNSKWLAVRLEKRVHNYGKIYKVFDVETGIEFSPLINENHIEKGFFSSDGKYLLTIKDTSLPQIKIWDLVPQKEFLTTEVHDIDDKVTTQEIDSTFSSDNRWLIYKNKYDPLEVVTVYNVATNDTASFLKNKYITEAIFSPNSKWLFTRSVDGDEIWDLTISKLYFQLNDVTSLNNSLFSPDSKWLVYKDKNFKYKILEVNSCKEYFFLKDEKDISCIHFSSDSKMLITQSPHKISTWNLSTEKLIQSLWINKSFPTYVALRDNRYLFVTVGKSIIKTDIQTQQGNLFSYGDGEPLNYTYEEIQEWIKVFGDEFLMPLDNKIKKKYNIK